MRQTFYLSRQSQTLMLCVSALFGVIGAGFSMVGDTLSAAVVLGFCAVSLALLGRAWRDAFLVVDAQGVRCPHMLVDVRWDNLRRAHILRHTDLTEMQPILVLDVYDLASAGPGVARPGFLNWAMKTLGAPLCAIELPLLDKPVEDVIAAIEAAAPGKTGPEERRAFLTSDPL